MPGLVQCALDSTASFFSSLTVKDVVVAIWAPLSIFAGALAAFAFNNPHRRDGVLARSCDIGQPLVRRLSLGECIDGSCRCFGAERTQAWSRRIIGLTTANDLRALGLATLEVMGPASALEVIDEFRELGTARPLRRSARLPILQ